MALCVKEVIMPDKLRQTGDILWVVAAALINANGNVLVQKRAVGRSMAGLWEFPGGKIEAGESPETALARELEEELGINVRPEHLTPLSFASAPLGEKHLVLLLYLCSQWENVPTARDAEALQWIAVDRLCEIEMPPADIPLVEALLRQERMRETSLL
jgi:8-oxo-dGTP diphosphatase